MKSLGLPAEITDWVVGKKDLCRKCGFQVEFEAKDAASIKEVDNTYYGEFGSGNMYIEWTCPNCRAANTINGPSRQKLIEDFKKKQLLPEYWK